MPTTLPSTSRFATMSATQVLAEQARIAARDAAWMAQMRARVVAALAL